MSSSEAIELCLRFFESPKAFIPSPHAQGLSHLEGAASLPKVDQNIHVSHNQGYGWGFAPGSVVEQGNIRSTINSLGLRGEEVQEKQTNEIRILTLGDSCVYGYGVENSATFASSAAWELSTFWKQPVRAINGAIPGHSTEQSLRVLENVGPKVQPDYVVIANIWSDIYNGTHPKSEEESSFALVRTIQSWSKESNREQNVSWVYTGADVTTKPEEGYRVSLKTYRQNLLKLQKVASDIGATPIFLQLPAPVDFNDTIPEWIDAYRVVMELVAEETNTPLVDSVQWWKTHDPSMKDFYDNVHPSVSGHRKIGQSLFHTLQEEWNNKK